MAVKVKPTSKHTLTKKEISSLIHKQMGLPIAESAAMVELVFETMKACLAEGKELKISRFGNFHLHDKDSRRGRNPQTGEAIEIVKRRVVSFSASQVLRDILLGDESKTKI